MVVLITGASGGLGTVLGATLVERGLTVYGTMRNPTGKEGDYPFTLLPMEVTDAASVKACIEEVLRREGRIDALVNCVNQMVIGAFEEQTVDEVRSVFETNVFGMLRVCQAVLPVMRKQGSGAIVNMSSAGGFIAVPYMSAYTAAKSAVEALTESLYHETRHDPIDVVIMQPVAMAMDRPDTGAHLHMVNAVTAVAHQADADNVDDWQKLGGRVLDLPRSDWQRVAMAA